jgi:hypothetical protein
VHILCSVFIPEVSFTDATRLRVAEGISTIPRQRWTSVRLSFGQTVLFSLLYSVAVCVVRLVVPSSDAVIASKNTMHHAPGKMDIDLDLKSSRYAFTQLF